jgi:hypothetical protein
MLTASRTIKHISLHRLNGVEIRVVADTEEGVLPLIEAECQVVTRLAQEVHWQPSAVTLFILSDLAPLQRQLRALGRHPVGRQLDETDNLLGRPVVNAYDVAKPLVCHIFVNRKAMVAAGYWDDPLAIQGLLAHEHAHPLAECATTAAVRHLQLTLALRLAQPWAPDAQQATEWAGKAQNQLTALTRSIALLGPREVFTNEIALTAGFVQPLLHLNQQNVRNLVAGLTHRKVLQVQMATAVAQGRLSQVGADTLLVIGDLQGHLMMAMEVAAFQRQGRAEAEGLLAQLQGEVFPYLDPLVGLLFQKICAGYVGLSTTASPQEMAEFVGSQLDMLVTILAERSMHLTYWVTIA